MKNLYIFTIFIFSHSLLFSQSYVVGYIVENYSLTDYNSGEEIQLYDLGKDGGVLVLEWFAWWCPFCANAANNVKSGIVEYYQDRMGNEYGLPVKHVSLNVVGNARSQSDTFINRYGLETVLEDYDRAFFNLFSPGNGQPLFVVINAEPDSPSAVQWEVLYTRLNYAGNEAPDISALMRPVIDSIQPGETMAGKTLSDLFPALEPSATGWVDTGWFGWLYNDGFPFVTHLELGSCFLLEGPGSSNIFIYDYNKGWFFTGPSYYPNLYDLAANTWLYYLKGTNGEWFYNYASGQWQD